MEPQQLKYSRLRCAEIHIRLKSHSYSYSYSYSERFRSGFDKPEKPQQVFNSPFRHIP